MTVRGPAAAITSLARHTLRAAARYEAGPADMLCAVNEALLRTGDGTRLGAERLAAVLVLRIAG